MPTPLFRKTLNDSINIRITVVEDFNTLFKMTRLDGLHAALVFQVKYLDALFDD